MAEVWVDQNKPIAVALALFKKRVADEGIMKELRKREHYVKPSVAKKLKSREARENAAKRKNKMKRERD